jgi:hypothetical protein
MQSDLNALSVALQLSQRIHPSQAMMRLWWVKPHALAWLTVCGLWSAWILDKRLLFLHPSPQWREQVRASAAMERAQAAELQRERDARRVAEADCADAERSLAEERERLDSSLQFIASAEVHREAPRHHTTPAPAPTHVHAHQLQAAPLSHAYREAVATAAVASAQASTHTPTHKHQVSVQRIQRCENAPAYRDPRQ